MPNIIILIIRRSVLYESGSFGEQRRVKSETAEFTISRVELAIAAVVKGNERRIYRGNRFYTKYGIQRKI